MYTANAQVASKTCQAFAEAGERCLLLCNSLQHCHAHLGGQSRHGAVRRGPAHLEHHAHMLAVGPHMLKVVVQTHAVLLIPQVARLYLRQQRDLVARSVAVVRRTFLHLRKQSTAGVSSSTVLSHCKKATALPGEKHGLVLRPHSAVQRRAFGHLHQPLELQQRLSSACGPQEAASYAVCTFTIYRSTALLQRAPA